MPRVLTVVNTKGGTGKTLLSMLIAESLGYQGFKVLVVDTDPQGTAMHWATCAPVENPFPAAVVGMAQVHNKLPQQIKQLAGDYEFIVIDCPPAVDAKVTQSALLIADVSITPLQPTAPDLWGTEAMISLMRQAQQVNPTLSCLAVANRVLRTRLCHAAVGVLREDTDLTVLETTLAQRASYQEAPAVGSAPARMKGSRHKSAAAESQALVQEIFDRMGWSA